MIRTDGIKAKACPNIRYYLRQHLIAGEVIVPCQVFFTSCLRPLTQDFGLSSRSTHNRVIFSMHSRRQCETKSSDYQLLPSEIAKHQLESMSDHRQVYHPTSTVPDRTNHSAARIRFAK